MLLVLGSQLVVQAQGKVISGVVKDGNEPVIGATVLEKGIPTNGTATDLQGRFTVTLTGTSNTLVVSSIGYVTKEINVANTASVTVQLLTDTKALEEVVVVGYGTQTKSTVTGAVSAISRNEIRQTPSASLQNTLTGKVTGFVSQQRGGQPGADAAQFFIRGVSTFNGDDQTPLILVDDIEYSYTQFSRIDPNEVETITILKDAATTAIYGIKGANGVILVTTRRGKTGPPKVSFRTELGIQKPTHVPNFLDAYQTALLRNEAIANTNKINNENRAPEFTTEDLEHFQNGTDPYGHPNVDWYDVLFKTSAPMNTNNLDISGGTEKVKYFLSAGFLNQGGMMRDFTEGNDVNGSFNYKRYNFRSNIDIQATKSLAFKLDVTGNFGQKNAPKVGSGGPADLATFREVFNWESLSPSAYPIYNPDGSYGTANPNSPQAGTNNIVGRLRYGGYNLARENYLNFNFTTIKKLDEITKGLSARASISASNENTSNRTMSRSNFPSFYYNATDDTYTPRDINVYRVMPWALVYDQGDPVRQTNIQANLAYTRSFGVHNINGLLLFNQTTKLRAFRPNRGEDESSNYIPDNFRGFTTRIGYNFKEKYLVEVSGAYNGSDRFLDHYGLFPAVSLGWNLAEESFLRNVEFINNFKLRGSYGIVGSDNTGRFKYVYNSQYDQRAGISFGDTHNGFTGAYEELLPNTEVTWEKERKANLGLDFSFFNGKLSGTAEYFDNFRYDILAERNTIPSYFGIVRSTLPPVNLGEVSNKGYEAELTHRGEIGKVGYNIRGNISVAKNKIVFMDEAPVLYPWTQQTGNSIGAVRQHIWDGFYTQEEVDIINEERAAGQALTIAAPPGNIGAGYLKYRDLNGDGNINLDDRGYFGKSNIPQTNLGLGFGFNYKGLSFNALFQSARDFDIRPFHSLIEPWKANLKDFHLKRWTPETAETAEFPVLITDFVGSYMTPDQASDFWSIRGNYIRLRSIELGYEIPQILVSRVGLGSARIYANGYNLLSWSKTFDRYGYDPEVISNLDGGIYPQQAIYNIGINVSFK